MKYQSQALRFSLEQRRLLDSQSCNQYDITGEDILTPIPELAACMG